MKNLKPYNTFESKDIDPFNEENWDEKLTLTQEEFEQEKNLIVDNINNLINSYDEFTKHVSPKYWRTTSHHFSNLKEMMNDISNFTLITKKERDNIDRMNF